MAIFSLGDVPGKGKGLVATEDIARGTRIVEETPIITIPDEAPQHDVLKFQIVQQMNSLSEQQQQSMLSMHNIYPYSDIAERCLGIIRTNALPIDADGIGGGLFLKACRINHSCNNNARKSWNQRIQRHTVHALRDIPKGEEITIYYLNSDSARAVRQKRLQDKFGFLCSCELCSLSEEESQQSDKRLARIDQLDDLIGRDCMSMNFSLRTLGYAEERVRLYEEQRPGDSGLSRTYMDAAQIAIAKGDLARGRIFADRAVDGWRASGGNDSQEVLEHGDLPKHPGKLQLYGLSMEWKTSVNEIPQGLDRGDFEDWLWRRETKAKRELIQCSTGFRDQAIFPSFAGLPNKGGFFNIYEGSPNTDQPLKYWCFLGKITNVSSLLHLKLELKDLNYKKLLLYFYTK
jgi:hypothetical protein